MSAASRTSVTVASESKAYYDVPNLDILTVLFESDSAIAKESTKLHIDASDPSLHVTKAEARKLTKQIAHGLRHQYGVGASGLDKDVVVAFSSGQYMLPVIFYAVVAAGGIYSAASASYTPSELARQVLEGEPKVIICSADLTETAIAAAKQCNIPLSRVLVMGSNPKPSLTSIAEKSSCISSQELEWRRITDPQQLDNITVCLLYSSGTTGKPKGVCISHTNFVAEGLIPFRMFREHRQPLEDAGEPPFEYRTLAHLPSSHVAGLQCYFINPFFHGGECYWMTKFDWPKFLEYNEKYRITYFFTVPPIWLLIARSDLVKDHFDSLKHCASGAAPLGRELQLAASKRLGKGTCWMSQTWGMSETTGSLTIMPFGDKDETGSVSPMMPHCQLRVLDDAGNDVTLSGSDMPGELVVKGPVVAKRYFKNNEATQESFTVDGWYKTGDVGYVQDSLVYVVDRKKEMIKYKGLQVAPAEIEALLLSHPAIADAAVIGVPGEATELPRAYVVADKTKISEDDVKEFVRSRLAPYKQLRGGVVFLPAIPKSPSGKILRKDLRAMAAKETRAKL